MVEYLLVMTMARRWVGMMACPLRIQYEGAVYHVMCRGNQGAALFTLAKERDLFFHTLEEVIDRTGWIVHA